MALCKTLLISEQEVKDITDISDNVDVSKFCHHIPIAQKKHIKGLIGKTCYAELLDQVEHGTLTVANEDLLDGDGGDFEGIKTALAWWVLYEAYPNLYSTITPTGIHTKEPEGLASVSDVNLTMRINKAKNNAEMYSEEVICFLKNNLSDYPCFSGCSDCCDTLKKSGYGDSGICLSDSSDDCNCDCE